MWRSKGRKWRGDWVVASGTDAITDLPSGALAATVLSSGALAATEAILDWKAARISVSTSMAERPGEV